MRTVTDRPCCEWGGFARSLCRASAERASVEKRVERTSEEVKECYRDKGFACCLPLLFLDRSLTPSLVVLRSPLYTPWYMRELLWRMDFCCTVTCIARASGISMWCGMPFEQMTLNQDGVMFALVPVVENSKLIKKTQPNIIF